MCDKYRRGLVCSQQRRSSAGCRGRRKSTITGLRTRYPDRSREPTEYSCILRPESRLRKHRAHEQTGSRVSSTGHMNSSKNEHTRFRNLSGVGTSFGFLGQNAYRVWISGLSGWVCPKFGLPTQSPTSNSKSIGLCAVSS